MRFLKTDSRGVLSPLKSNTVSDCCGATASPTILGDEVYSGYARTHRDSVIQNIPMITTNLLGLAFGKKVGAVFDNTTTVVDSIQVEEETLYVAALTEYERHPLSGHLVVPHEYRTTPILDEEKGAVIVFAEFSSLLFNPVESFVKAIPSGTFLVFILSNDQLHDYRTGARYAPLHKLKQVYSRLGVYNIHYPECGPRLNLFILKKD